MGVARARLPWKGPLEGNMLSLLKSVNVNPKGRTWKGCRVLRDSLQHPVTLPPNNVVSQRETALWLPGSDDIEGCGECGGVS